MCLGPTKANVAEGEFAGVELTFMGLNNQNLHNVLFRGLLYAWEQYTGAKINWIDLAQADYNPRLQQAIDDRDEPDDLALATGLLAQLAERRVDRPWVGPLELTACAPRHRRTRLARSRSFMSGFALLYEHARCQSVAWRAPIPNEMRARAG